MNLPLRKSVAWILGVTAALVALVFLAQLILAPLAADALTRLVAERSEGRYELATSDLDLSFWRGRIALEGVALTPDTSELARAAKLTGGIALGAEVEQLAISGISWWHLLVNRRLSADSLTVTQPRIMASAYQPPGPPRPTGPNNAGGGGDPTSGGSAELPGAIEIDGIRIRDAGVRYELLGQDTTSSRLAANEVDLLLAGFRLDSITFRRYPTRFYDRFAISVGGYRHELGDSLHVVTLGAARFESEDGRLTLDSLHVEPRDSGFSFRQNHPQARLALQLACDTVRLRGFDLGEFLRTQRYRARRLSVDSVDATAWMAGESDGGVESGSGAADSSGGYAFDLRLDTLALSGATLRYRARAPDLALDLPNAETTLVDVRSRPGDRERPFAVAEVDVRFRDFEYERPEVDNRLRIATGRISLAGQTLRLDSLSYRPPDPAGFARSNRSTFDLQLRSLELDSLDLPTLFWRQRVAAHGAAVDGLRIVSTTNHGQPPPPDDPRTLLLRQLQELPVALALDLVTVEDGYIGYRRFGGDKKDATIFWDDVFATFGRVGTYPDYVERYPRASLDTRSVFQGVWPLKMSVQWPNGEGAPYEVSASGPALDLSELNSMLVPVADMRIKSGKLDSLSLDFAADAEAGNGKLRATYRDFEVELLGDGPKADDKDVLSSFADALAVRDANVPGGGEYRVGTIRAEREASLSMFTHWWELVRSGLLGVVLTDFGQSRVEGK